MAGPPFFLSEQIIFVSSHSGMPTILWSKEQTTEQHRIISNFKMQADYLVTIRKKLTPVELEKNK